MTRSAHGSVAQHDSQNARRSAGPTLDGIGQNGDRLAFDAFSGAEGLQDTRQIVSAQFSVSPSPPHRSSLLVAGLDLIACATPVDDNLRIRRHQPGRGSDTRRSTFVDPIAQPVAGHFKESFLVEPYLSRMTCQPLASKSLRVSIAALQGNEVKALAIEIDDPP